MKKIEILRFEYKIFISLFEQFKIKQVKDCYNFVHYDFLKTIYIYILQVFGLKVK